MSQTANTKPSRIKTHPFLTHWELAALGLCSASLLLISVLIDAPVEGPADPAGIPFQNVKAPWIFVGIQQALKWMPPELAGVILPLLAVISLGAIPYLRIPALLKQVLFVAITSLTIGLTIWGFL